MRISLSADGDEKYLKNQIIRENRTFEEDSRACQELYEFKPKVRRFPITMRFKRKKVETAALTSGENGPPVPVFYNN
jgi:hypothetical protein